MTNTNTSIACSQAAAQERAVISRSYQGMVFQFREDGYFNMTKAAKHFGKRMEHFWENKDTSEYVAELKRVFNHRNSGDCPIVQAFHGGKTPGTWGHPKLAVFFARWLDVKFAVWCDMVIDDLLRGKAQATITKPEESAVLALPKDYVSALRALLASVEAQEKLQAKMLGLR